MSCICLSVYNILQVLSVVRKVYTCMLDLLHDFSFGFGVNVLAIFML